VITGRMNKIKSTTNETGLKEDITEQKESNVK
jgi:hypothetical protein